MDRKKTTITFFLVLIFSTATFVASKDFIVPIVTDTASEIRTFFLGDETLEPIDPQQAEIREAIILNEVVPTKRYWKRMPQENKTLDIADFIEAEWEAEEDDLKWKLKLKLNQSLKDEIDSSETIRDFELLASKYFGNETKWEELKNATDVPISIFGEESKFSVLDGEIEIEIELSEWKDGLQIIYGFGTEIWQTSTQCTINTSRNDYNEDIIALCDVHVNNGAMWTFENGTFQLNITSDDEYDLYIDNDGYINWTNITTDTWNNSAYSYQLYFKGQGNISNSYFNRPGGTDHVYINVQDYANITFDNLRFDDIYCRFYAGYWSNTTLSNSTIDCVYILYISGYAYMTIQNTTFGDGSGTEYFFLADQSETVYIRPYSSLTSYIDYRLYDTTADTTVVRGYFDAIDSIDWRLLTSGQMYQRFYPLFVYDEADGTTPVANVVIKLKNETGVQQLLWQGTTNALGYVELNVTFPMAGCDKDRIIWQVGIYANDVFKGNFTCENDTHPDGLVINVTVSGDTTPPDINWASPTQANGTLAINQTWVEWNITSSENIGTCTFEVNATNVTETVQVDAGADSYCYYNETGLTGNVTSCAIAYANDTTGNLNMTDTMLCFNTNEQQGCVPNLQNTTWTNEGNTSCNISDLLVNWSWLIEFDANLCGGANQTYYDNETLSCNYCSYDNVNTSWSAWTNQTDCMIMNLTTQNRSLTEWDQNNDTCYAVTGLPDDLWNSGENITHWEYQNISCDNCSYNITNTSWSAWQNQTSCFPNGTLTQNRSLEEWDTNKSSCCDITELPSDCFTNVTYWEYQSANCTYELTIIINWTEPTANGTEAVNKTYIFYNASVTANMTDCQFEINGTNETGSFVNADNESYCYFNKTGLTDNQTVCAIGWASNIDGAWNRTETTICRNINYSAPSIPEVTFQPIFPVRLLFNYWGYSVISWGDRTCPDNYVDISGDTMTGNLIAPNVWLPAYIFAHTDDNQTVIGSGVWMNVSFDEDESNPKSRITHTHNDNTNNTFIIQDNGIYDISYHMTFSDSAPAPDGHVEMRITKNGVEIEGSLLEEDSSKQYDDFTISNGVIISLVTGDRIIIQFTSDDTTITNHAHTQYGDHTDNAVIKIRRIG